jgi:putative transposase
MRGVPARIARVARKIRLEFSDACYHVINRGNYRQDLFAGRGAAESFQQCLFETCGAFTWRLHAFVIMRNHFHLAVETPEPNLSEGMKWLQGTWAMRFNRYRGECGRPFQGRYKALHVEPGHALAQVAHYIHLNPVRAGIVCPERLSEYRLSSLSCFLRKDRPSFLQPSVLTECGGLPDTRSGWMLYVQYLGVLAEEEGKMREKRFGRLSRGWVIGSKEFRTELKTELAKQVHAGVSFALLGADRAAQLLAREALGEEKIREIAAAFKIDLDQLPPKKSAMPKLVLAAMMKSTTSVTNRWLATRLSMGKPSSIGSLLRRFRLDGGTQTARFKRILSRFMT